jgi:hypothetical protein
VINAGPPLSSKAQFSTHAGGPFPQGAKLGGVVNPQPADNNTVPLEAGRNGQILLGSGLAGVGVAGLAVAAALYPSAASPDGTPFVLVAGLLLNGAR